MYRVAAKVQFRASSKSDGQRQSVNDVWIGKVLFQNNKALLYELHEYLDGRVRFLQQYNILEYGESAQQLFPWQNKVQGRESCNPRVTHSCSDAPCLPSEFCQEN